MLEWLVCVCTRMLPRWLLLSGFFFFFRLRYDRNDAIGVMNIWCCWTLYSLILDIFLSICLIPSIIQTSLSIYTGRKWNQVIRVYWKVLLEFFFLLLKCDESFAELSTSFLNVYSGDRSLITPLVTFATNFAMFSAFYAALLSYIAGQLEFAFSKLI